MLASSIVFSLLTTALLWLARRRNLASDPRITLAALMILLALPLMSFAPKFVITGTPLLPQQLGNQGPEYLGLFFTIWIIGLGLGLARTRSSLSVFRKWKKRSSPIPDRSPFVELCQDLKENAQIEIRVHSELRSPVVAGLVHPVIYLPKNLSKMVFSNPANGFAPRTLPYPKAGSLDGIARSLSLPSSLV